jgi:protein phosphatase
MGGTEAGERASETAVVTLLANLGKPALDRAGPAGTEGMLRAAFDRSQADVLALQSLHRRAGCSATLLLWRRGADHVHVAHVGDSRAHHLSGRDLNVLTVAHNVARALVAAGTISPEEARTMICGRGVLYRYLGCAELNGSGLVDLTTVPIRAGDCFLLCCDGLYHFETEEDVIDRLRRDGDPRRRAESLCQLALDRGSRDNVSAVVIDFDAD